LSMPFFDSSPTLRTEPGPGTRALRVLRHLLRGGISGLSASEQAVYLRLRSGTCRCGVERLVAWTGLSRTTVLSALRRLRDRGLLRPYPREPKRETAWLVEVPEPALPGLPEGLQEEQRPAAWLADRMDPEDLELARGLLDSLSPSRREELEREAVEQFGDLDPEELQKAVLELVARRSFGPDRLRRNEGQ
jgi:DNA-binding transcriptional ArsR family regulator